MSDNNEKSLQVVPDQAKEVVREQDKAMLVLSYIGLLSLIPLLTVKDSEFVKWHARQGLALSLAFVAVWIVSFFPILGTLVFLLGSLGIVVLSIIGIVKALDGVRWKIPVIESIAAKLNF